MSSNPPQTFSNISPAQYAKLIEKARAAGMDLDGNSGTATKFGVEISWNYVPESQQLTFQCLKTPFFLSAADVHSRLDTLVRQTLAS